MPAVSAWRGLFYAIALSIFASVAGCNVYDDVGPSATSVEGLLADARVALTNENPKRAVRLLERAHEKDSTDVEVRIELANALYAVHDVDVFAVRAAAKQLNGEKPVSGTDRGGQTACSNGVAPSGSPEWFLTVSFDAESPLGMVAARAPQLRRVSSLLVAGVLARRPDTFAEMSPAVQAKGYLLAGLTRTSRRLLGVRTAVLDTESALYVDTETSSPSLVVCSSGSEARAQVERTLCRLRSGIQQSLDWLQARNEHVHSDQTGLLIDTLTRQAATLLGRLSCARATDARPTSPLRQLPSSG